MNSSYGMKGKVYKLQPFSSEMVSDPDMQAEIQSLFSKVKTYARSPKGEWSIPDANVVLRHSAEEHRHLQELKAALNAVKNQLSDKDVDVWHQHTNSTNRAGKVIYAVRSVANAEICTQAWCKFYEILGTFSLLPAEALRSGELNTVHLCEAPGAFIAAMNHYIKTNKSTQYCDWCWAANTLNPYHEANGGGATIADDRLIANTLPRWFFGSDNTGNIMIQKHLLEMQAFVSDMSRVDLVTADGSFDCQENPDEQEALVASLLFCEVTAALLLLGPGGSFVLKMFTLYEHSSVSLLYLLNCCFQSVSVFKPATSKAGNSEVYVVCLNYDSKEAVRPLISKLVRNYGPDLADREALFPKSLIPASFLKQHKDVCSYFHALQVETIRENLRLFEEMSAELRQWLEGVRDGVVQRYLQQFQVCFLPRNQRISRNTVTPACCRVAAFRPLGQKKRTGSFNERKQQRSLDWKERMRRSGQADCVQEHIPHQEEPSVVLNGPPSGCHVDLWYVITGSVLPAIRNSSFCEAELLNRLNEAQTEAAVDWTRTPPCKACQPVSASDVLAEVASFLNLTENKKRCLVFGSSSVWASSANLDLTFSPEPSFPQRSFTSLHDGEPVYQRQLLGCLTLSLQTLSCGDALLLPLVSALTRVTAAVVLCLHACFRSVSYRCPQPSGAVGALLLCVGFCPEAASRMLPFLTDVQKRMGELPGADKQQVLQFVPMETLLSGGLTDFLWTMNSEIIQQKLHLLMRSH